MIMMYRIYTAAFIRTTTITYILQRFMTTIVPVIHYCGEAEGEQQQGEENELQRKVGFSGRELVVLFLSLAIIFSHM